MGFDPTDVTETAGLAPLAPAEVAVFLGVARDHVIRELTALGDQLAGWKPTPDEWSANECVGHLIEADRRGFAGRIRRILAEDGVAEPGWDQEAVAAAAATGSVLSRRSSTNSARAGTRQSRWWSDSARTRSIARQSTR